MSTPFASGHAVPFEGDAQEAVWTAWPARADLWGDRLVDARREVADLIRALAPQPVHVLVADDATWQDASQSLHGLDVSLHLEPYGDIWLRDTLPVFTRGPDGAIGHVAFRFDGWGGKYRLDGDEDLAARMQARWPGPGWRMPWVLEGGSVETDGIGTVLTTRQCLLDGIRNPGWTKTQAEAHLRDAYGAEHVVWIDEGLLNDHTDGHVDTIARFLRPGVVCCMRPSGPEDPNAAVLASIEATLRQATDARGRPLEVVTVPSPGRVLGDGGQILPASHVNFLIGNDAVVVPVYGTATGEQAVDTLRPWFPGRRVVGVSARALVEGGGALHCITQHQPAPHTQAPHP